MHRDVGNCDIFLVLDLHKCKERNNYVIKFYNHPSLGTAFQLRLKIIYFSPRHSTDKVTLTIFIRILFFFRLRLNILIFLPILGWKYSCKYSQIGIKSGECRQNVRLSVLCKA